VALITEEVNQDFQRLEEAEVAHPDWHRSIGERFRRRRMAHAERAAQAEQEAAGAQAATDGAGDIIMTEAPSAQVSSHCGCCASLEGLQSGPRLTAVCCSVVNPEHSAAEAALQTAHQRPKYRQAQLHQEAISK